MQTTHATAANGQAASGMAPVNFTPRPKTDFDVDQRRFRLITLWKEVEAAMGRRYSSRTFDNFVCATDAQRAVKQQVISYAENWLAHAAAGQGIFAYGPCGSGKDLMLSAALRHVVRMFWASPAWTDGQLLFARMRDAIGGESSESSILAPFTNADVLLLSDPIPGNADKSVTDWQQGILWRVVDARYRALKPTWCTLNVANESEAVARLGAQLVDRLIDGALCLKFDWPSARKPLS